MTFCENCGTQVADDQRFCGACGKPATRAHLPQAIAAVPFGKILIFATVGTTALLFVAMREPGETRSSNRFVSIGFGQYATIRASTACAPTIEAMNEIYRWSGVSENEFLRAIGRTKSVVLGDGDRVTILDRGMVRTQVRLESGETCWIASEHVR